jgi:hypothetical protein
MALLFLPTNNIETRGASHTRSYRTRHLVVTALCAANRVLSGTVFSEAPIPAVRQIKQSDGAALWAAPGGVG